MSYRELDQEDPQSCARCNQFQSMLTDLYKSQKSLSRMSFLYHIVECLCDLFSRHERVHRLNYRRKQSFAVAKLFYTPDQVTLVEFKHLINESMLTEVYYIKPIDSHHRKFIDKLFKKLNLLHGRSIIVLE